MPTVRELGEDRLVAEVLAVLAPPPTANEVVVAAGDDAAILAASGAVVVSTDTLVAGVDFRFDWSTGGDVGAKTAAACLADLAAMGARPQALLLSLTVPAATEISWVLDLAAGAVAECARAGATIVGGDMASGSEVVVTGTAVGRFDEGVHAVLRSGAEVGDTLAVAGRLGDSAAGLALLAAGGVLDTPAAAAVLAGHRRPTPDYEAGVRAARSGATSLIDVSDGLVRDARRLAVASNVTIDLDPVALAPSGEAESVAKYLGADALDWVLTGGEDHAMLATFGRDVALPEGFRAIGRVTQSATGADVTLAGLPYRGAGGWVHFSA